MSSFSFPYPVGIIFDFDGTIYDDIPVTRRIVERLREYYRSRVTNDQFEDIFSEVRAVLSGTSNNIRMLKCLLHAAKRLGVPFPMRWGVFNIAQQFYKEEIMKCKLFPGVRELLQNLQRVAKLGLFTSTPYPKVAHRLNQDVEILKYFENGLMTGEMVRHEKPHPEGILRLLNFWQIPANHVLFLGDMPTDIEAAHRAKCIGVGILTGYASRKDFDTSHPEFICENLDDFARLLPTIFSK